MRDFARLGGFEEPQKGGRTRERKRWGCEARSKDIRDGILNDSFAIRLSSPLSSSSSSSSVCSRIRAKRRVPSCNLLPSSSSSSFSPFPTWIDPKLESSKKHDDSVPSRNGLPNLLWNLLFGDRAPPSPQRAIEWRTPAKRRHDFKPRNLRHHPPSNPGSREYRWILSCVDNSFRKTNPNSIASGSSESIEESREGMLLWIWMDLRKRGRSFLQTYVVRFKIRRSSVSFDRGASCLIN